MVLDICCIILALITSVFDKTQLSKLIQKMIVGRYLDMQASPTNLQNDPYSLLTNKSAAKEVLNLHGDV